MGSEAVEGGAEEEKWLRKERSGLIWPLFYVLFLHIVAFYFFTRGFLLTRTELSFVSNCSDAAAAPCRNSCVGSHMESRFPNEDVEIAGSLLVEKQNKCWTKPAVDRLIIIVLDALRFDFVAPSTFFEGKKPWMDKLKVLQKLASDKEYSARIFKAIADPPTTSLQRLKVREGIVHLVRMILECTTLLGFTFNLWPVGLQSPDIDTRLKLGVLLAQRMGFDES